MKTIQLVKNKKVEKTIEVKDEDFAIMMHRAKMRAELLKRDSKDDWSVREEPKEPEVQEE